jgi:phthalate 4,5-cis-dihydrodiol dehydrogenase
VNVRLGILGLGRAAQQTRRALRYVPDVRLTAVADINQHALQAFACDASVKRFGDVRYLCEYEDVDTVWVATPSSLHCEHVIALASAGKHVICEKPMALSLSECDRMIEAAASSGTQLMLVSKIFDRPIRCFREIIESGRIGRAVTINSLVHTDWLLRPRAAHELDTVQGGGVVLRQAPHLVDIARYLARGAVRDVKAEVGRCNPSTNADGNFNALITFDNSVSASLTLDGYGYFDSSELTWGYGETGSYRDPDSSVGNHGGIGASHGPGGPPSDSPTVPRTQTAGLPYYGQTVVSCERGAMRQSPRGVFVYSERGREEIPVEPTERCVAELIEMRDAIAGARPAFPDGHWGRATLEVCLAMLKSSETHGCVTLSR